MARRTIGRRKVSVISKPDPAVAPRSDGRGDLSRAHGCVWPPAACHIVQRAVAERIGRRRDLGRRVLSAVLEALARYGVPFGIRVLLIGQIQSPVLIDAKP